MKKLLFRILFKKDFEKILNTVKQYRYDKDIESEIHNLDDYYSGYKAYYYLIEQIEDYIS